MGIPARSSALILISALALFTICLSGTIAHSACTKPASQLERLACKQFPELKRTETKCEESLLRNLADGHVTNCDLLHDKDGVPENADKAGQEQYDVNAKLIRWLCVDPQASKLVDPRGIQLRAARVVGELDLSFVAVPFSLFLINSRFTENLNVLDAKVPELNLMGTWVPGINGDGVKVANDVFLRNGFRSEGEVRLLGAEIGGDLTASDGSFLNHDGEALNADGLKVTGSVFLSDGFRSEGNVRLVGADIGSDLVLDGARFAGKSRLVAERMTVKGGFYWQDLKVEKDAQVELDRLQTKVGVLFDDRESWQGYLDLDGFEYSRIGTSSPEDAESRLQWLELQRKDQAWKDFSTQPYEQLAKVLAEAGDSGGQKRVLIAMEDARRQYGGLGWPRWFWWFWGWVLKITIGYGYAPFRAFLWIAAFVALGTVLFFFGRRAGAITLSEAKQPQYYRPFNSFVYSLETFLPLVELHQATHWRPDSEQSAFGRFLRAYLWFHILLGWFFTSMLIAGITGLVHRS